MREIDNNKLIKMNKIKRLNLKSQFNEYSGLFPLIANPGADTFDRVSFFVLASFLRLVCWNV
jgi:hypothetical protein